MSPPAPIVSLVAPGPHRPFPVDPDDVPVRVVKRTVLRHADRDPMDDYLARLIVAGVIAILAEPGADPETVELGAAVVSGIAAGTGLVVAIQAVPAGGLPA